MKNLCYIIGIVNQIRKDKSVKIKQITYDFENLEEMIISIKAGKKVFRKYESGTWGEYVPHQEIKVNFDKQTISYVMFWSASSSETVEREFDEIDFEKFELIENF